ncbi:MULTISPECIES: hypothetical protein [unclassified Dyella]|uniref:hypothetical protein n=1 Tax=unclassified Dyella TaxID=2634549 RepID=UPI000C837CD5|nr:MULTISPECIES: hypothetical protein [unclassified Dyella]MDR3445490.1 hypothetical protein [Dyella sp.]PMQ05284.1 hypothetical protein DyAD56_10595 [Dyella sp. AD56]
MVKWILLVILAGAAWWHFDYSHRMTETQINAAYADHVDAFRRFDADAICAHMSEDFVGDETVRQGEQSVQRHYGKEDLCKQMRRNLDLMKRLSAASGGLIELDIELEIKSIELTVNRKLATVETVYTARLGDMTLARERTTEHLIRRNGRILSTDAESKVWAYSPQ